MESTSTTLGSRRKIIPICGMFFTFSFAYSIGSYSYGEYGHEAFWKKFRPDGPFKNHTHHSLCDANTSSREFQEEQIVQSLVSKWSTYMSLAQGLPLLVSSGLFCTLSDSFGRKPFVLVSLVGVFLKTFLMCLAVEYNWNVYLFILFIFVDGCCGTWVVQVAMSMAMVSDLTIEGGKSRSFLITVVGFFLSLGYALASFTTGFIIRILGFNWSLGIATMLIIAPMILLYFVEETLQVNKRVQFECNISTYLRNLVQFYIEDDPIIQRSSKVKYILCLTAFICILFSRLGCFSVEIYYIMNTPFCFDPVLIGIFQTSKSIVSEFLILFGIKIMQYKLSDSAIALVGTITSVVSFVMIGSASSTGLLIAGKKIIYMYSVSEKYI